MILHFHLWFTVYIVEFIQYSRYLVSWSSVMSKCVGTHKHSFFMFFNLNTCISNPGMSQHFFLESIKFQDKMDGWIDYNSNWFLSSSGEWNSLCCTKINHGYRRKQPAGGWECGHSRSTQTLHVRTDSSPEVTTQGQADLFQGKVPQMREQACMSHLWNRHPQIRELVCLSHLWNRHPPDKRTAMLVTSVK